MLNSKNRLLIIFVILFLSVRLDARELRKKEVFPLSKGNYWIYQGVVKAAQSGSDIILEKKLTWKMEVENLIIKDSVAVAFIKGYPADLAWYEKGQGRGEYLIVNIDDRKFYLVKPLVKEKFLLKFNHDSKEAVSLLDD